LAVKLVAMLRCIGAVLVLSGCASLTVADTKPLGPAKLAPPGAPSISEGGYRLPTLPPHTEAPDLLVLVAMSGGGKRSSSFGYGALTRMREPMVRSAGGPVSLLSQLSGISGASGGSFPAAYYGLYRDAAGLPLSRHQRLHLRHLPAAVALDLDRRPGGRHKRLHEPRL
jgi:hypothetical protein